MQCPNCNCELGDQSQCLNCDRNDKASAETISVPKGDAGQELTDDSNAPLLPEVVPQVADSPHTSTATTDSPERDEAPSREPALPVSNGETTKDVNTINSQGDQIFLGQAAKTIENIYQTEVHDSEVHAGRDVAIGTHITIQTGAQSSKAEEEKSLYSLTQELPRRAIELPESVRAEVDCKVAQLKNTRLMFITCPFAEFAVDAGHVAVRGLGLENSEQNRMLYYEDTVRKNLEFTAQNLLEQIPEEKDERAILIYAQKDSAQSFLDSIFDTPARIDAVRAGLQRNGLFLVVIVAPQYAQKRLSAFKRTPPFAYAEIPFLRPFLQRNYPDTYERLEAKITEQRAQEKWEKDESNFCRQIIDHDAMETLEAVVANGGPDDPELSAKTLLKGSSPVVKTVLYTAAFFQEITPLEFCRVVETLLNGRTISVTSPNNGSHVGDAPVQTQSEVPLTRIWEEEKDCIFSEWLRETTVGKESVRVVSLSSSALREPLRRLFEKQHRFYVIDQFKALQERGIFFYPSLRLAENTTRIAVEMAGHYPDEFNEIWVLELVSRISNHFDFDSSSPPDGEDAMFQFLRSSQSGAWNLALARVSEVFRRMLELPQLDGMVHSALEQLIKSGYHEDTLLLTKHLQFTPGFDELYWFKQLLHRADDRTRHLTYYYLYAYLRQTGSGVYERLKKIETWLPPIERAPLSYSQFDYFVLRLLIQYGVETVARFNAKHYGDWPSRYPLFAIKDGEAATERVSLLARWLLHPGIGEALVKLRMGGTQMTLVGALLAEWAFILLGPKAASPAEKSTTPTTGTAVATNGDPAKALSPVEYSAAMLLDLLIEQFASRMNLSQRMELLNYLNDLNHDLLKYLAVLPRASELRSQLSWKRELVRQLIMQVKSAAAATRRTPAFSQR